MSPINKINFEITENGWNGECDYQNYHVKVCIDDKLEIECDIEHLWDLKDFVFDTVNEYEEKRSWNTEDFRLWKKENL